MTKALIGVLIGGAAAVVAAYVIKKKEKKYAEVQSSEKEVEEVEEDESIMEKIDRAARKMAEWILDRETVMRALDLILPVIFSSALFLVELFFKVRFGRKAVDKTLKQGEWQNESGDLTAQQALEQVKATKRNILLVDDDNFGYVISPEVAA